MFIRDRMSTKPHTITPETSVAVALKQMRDAQIRRLPVVDPAGHVVGIVTEKDLLNVSPSPATSLSMHELNYLLDKLLVAKVMTREVITVGEDTLVEEAARIMSDHDIGGLPVVRDARLVGIITKTDLFKVLLELLGARQHGVRLTMLLPEGKGILARITAAIAAQGGDIIALGTFLGDDPSNFLATIRVADASKDRLVQALQPLALKMLDAREV